MTAAALPSELKVARAIRTTPAFEILSVTTGDRHAVLVRARTPSAATDAAIARLVRGHEAVRHPRIPRAALVALEAGRHGALLACEADHAGTEVVSLMAARGEKIAWPAGDWFIDALRDALRAAHQSSLDGVPLALGRLGFGNVLFSANGAFFVIGFGANVPAENEHGALVTIDPVFCAPEVSGGAAATPSSDLVASLMLKRSLAPIVDLPPLLARALRGEMDDETREILELAVWFDREVIAEVPPRRPSVEHVLAEIDRFRDLLDVGLDREGFESLVSRLLAGTRVERTASTLAIDPGDHALTVDDGPRVRVGPALLRVISRLARDQDGASTQDLLAAGWPGETPVGGSGEARVYTAIKRLRQLGLADVIERVGGQYRIAPRVRVQHAP